MRYIGIMDFYSSLHSPMDFLLQLREYRLVVITFSKTDPERVRPSTSSSRLTCDYFKTPLSYQLLALSSTVFASTQLSLISICCQCQCLIRTVLSLETWNLQKVEVNGLKCIQVHSKQGNFRKKEMSIRFLNVCSNTTDNYVALEQELCLSSRSEYIRLIAIILGLPSEYDQ